jgi:hypothetical protein
MCNCSGNCKCSTGIPTGPRGATGATGPTGPAGATGATGTPGSVIREGAGVPSNGLGINGDYYINTLTGDLYYKAADVYTVVANLVGPAGATGAAGPASVMRLIEDQSGASAISDTTFQASITSLTADFYVLKFDFEFSSFDQTSFFGGGSLFLDDGVSPVSLFSITSTDLDAALVKFDVNPTLGVDSGYPSAEAINLLSGEITIERLSSTILNIKGIVYGQNIEVQEDFGGSKFIQKSWLISKTITVADASAFDLDVTALNSINGSSVKIFNILTYLVPNPIP